MEGLTGTSEQESLPHAGTPQAVHTPRSAPPADELARRLRDVIDGFGPAALIAVLTLEGRVIEANRPSLLAAGLTPGEVLGRRFDELSPFAHSPAVAQRLRASIERAARGEPARYDLQARIAGADAEVDFTLQPIRDERGAITHLVASGTIITERKRAEQQVRKLNRVYALLSEINHTLLRSSSRQATLDAACRIAVEKGGFLLAYVAWVEPDHSLTIAAHAGANEATLAVVRSMLAGDPFDCALTRQALSAGEHGVCNDIATDPLSVNWRASAMERGYRSMASLALLVQREVVGTLNLYSAETGFFDVEELRLLDALALDIAFALERTRIEQALRDSEERLRQIVRLTEIGIFDHDHTSNEVYWSPEQRRIYGVSAEEPVRFSRAGGVPRPSTWTLIHPLDRDRIDAALQRAHEEPDGLFDIEYRIIRRDGAQRWVSTRSQTFFEGSGKGRRALRTIGAVWDITERKRADRQLRLTQASVDRSGTAIFWVTAAGRVTYANDRACTSLGRTRAELLNMYVWDFDPDFPEARWLAVAGSMNHGQSSVSLTRHRRKDGTVFPVEASGDYLQFDGEAYIFVFAQDVTERQRAERELQLLSAAVNASHTPFFALTPAGRIEFANEYACRSLGVAREELVGSHLWDFNPEVTPELYQALWERLKREASITLQTRHRRKDGSYFPVEITTNYFSFKGEEYSLTSAQDITERISAEQHAIRAQRMEAIGTLAGGIAHDLNNTLAPILLALNSFKEQYPDEAEMLETVERSATHAAQMVRHLLSFAKGNEGQRSSLSPRRLLEDMFKLIKGTFPKNIEARLVLPAELPTVRGDATQLHQVLLNLCVNARDAMARGGTLTLEGDVVSSAEVAAEGWPGPGNRPARYVVLRIRDTGSGMSADTLARIFDPFFTTKGPESGTGLGLFTAAGIVKGHDGFMRVQSLPQAGSVFAIYLPAESQPLRTALAAPALPAAAGFRGAGEPVLFVDDERDVCEIARAVLTRLNFSPLLASDGESGLAQALANRNALRAVVTDLHMPRVDGLELVRRLRRELPGLAIIVASGRMEAATEQELRSLGVHVILDKPFTEDMLRSALQQALAQAP